MIITVDMTRELFEAYDTIDFYDGKTFFFDVPTILPKDLKIKVWGASIDYRFDWEKYIDVMKDDRLRTAIEDGKAKTCGLNVKGFGELELNDVVAGKISISPFDMTEKGNYTFFKDKKDKILDFKRQWNISNITSKCYEYHFDVNIAFPYGACELILYTEGNVNFSFNTDDCICYRDYLLNPNRRETFWGFIGTKEAETYSFNGFEL